MGKFAVSTTLIWTETPRLVIQLKLQVSSQKNDKERDFPESLSKVYITELRVQFKDIFGFPLQAFTDVPSWQNFRRVYS